MSVNEKVAKEFNYILLLLGEKRFRAEKCKI